MSCSNTYGFRPGWLRPYSYLFTSMHAFLHLEAIGADGLYSDLHEIPLDCANRSIWETEHMKECQ